MKVTLLTIGKTEEAYLQTGISTYSKRLERYTTFTIKEIPALKNAKNLSEEQQKNKEGELLLEQISGGDVLFLLDEKGKEFDSIAFSKFFQQHMNNSVKHLIFAVGGPYGFSDQVYKRATGKISLSKMTFSHQMVRLFFVEQMYRAFTILKNEPYHHS